jgi:acyl dehydratase
LTKGIKHYKIPVASILFQNYFKGGVSMPSEEIAKFIGTKTGGSVFEVEKEPIRRFADAVGDPNPLYSDEEYAKKAGYRSLVAPPGFISIPWNSRQRVDVPSGGGPGGGQGGLMAALHKAGYTNPGGVDGGIEYEFLKPVQAGDTITASSMIKDVVEREGRTGKMAFIINETTYTNQDGDVVAKARSTTIQR